MNVRARPNNDVLSIRGREPLQQIRYLIAAGSRSNALLERLPAANETTSRICIGGAAVLIGVCRRTKFVNGPEYMLQHQRVA